MTEQISVIEVEQITHQLAKITMTWDQPIPDFKTRFSNVLEGCLAAPFQTFSKKDLYPGLFDKAAILFYLLSKNHPFQNGNKRVAVTTLFYFLFKNGYLLEVPPDKLYKLALLVCDSDAEIKDAAFEAVKIILEKYTVRM